jgi:hypothetical protein
MTGYNLYVGWWADKPGQVLESFVVMATSRSIRAASLLSCFNFTQWYNNAFHLFLNSRRLHSTVRPGTGTHVQFSSATTGGGMKGERMHVNPVLPTINQSILIAFGVEETQTYSTNIWENLTSTGIGPIYPLPYRKSFQFCQKRLMEQ